MKQLLLSWYILFSLHCFSQKASDSAAIIQMLKQDYATMGSMDIPTHLNNVTSDYLLIEHGKIWDINGELDSIYRKDANETFTRTDFFSIKKVTIAGDMAYGVWYLRSEFKENDKTTELSWNESGVFRKEQGRWKIALIHSTLLKQ